MWVLPSRGRPKNIERLSKVWEFTGATTSVYLRLDEDDPALSSYRDIVLPDTWHFITGSRVPLSEIYREVYELFQERSWFGFIADDVVPETHLWDVTLIRRAMPDKMVVPAGGHDQFSTPHFVLGGDLVRDIGWLALPELDRLYIDTVWADIAEARGVLYYEPEVVLSHRHFSNRMAAYDATYIKHDRDRDKQIYDAWKREVSKSGYRSIR